MNRYEKGPAATNYYHNNGYDERWDMEADTGRKNYSILTVFHCTLHSIIVKHCLHTGYHDTRDTGPGADYPIVQNGYLNEQWNEDNGYHDNVTYDSRDETQLYDEREEGHLQDQQEEEVSDEVFHKEGEAEVEEQPPDIDHNMHEDEFENFKTGPFPKK